MDQRPVPEQRFADHPPVGRHAAARADVKDPLDPLRRRRGKMVNALWSGPTNPVPFSNVPDEVGGDRIGLRPLGLLDGNLDHTGIDSIRGDGVISPTVSHTGKLGSVEDDILPGPIRRGRIPTLQLQRGRALGLRTNFYNGGFQVGHDWRRIAERKRNG